MRSALAQLPNLLTLLRLGATPLILVLLKDRQYGLALTVFVVAGITDGLDGFIAKRFGLVSRLGSILDPMADKVLLVSTYAMLAWLQDIPFWLLVVVAFRDLVIIGGYLVLVAVSDAPTLMTPSNVSKVNTALQIGLVIAVLLERAGASMFAPLVDLAIPLVAVTTIASGAHYVWIWGIHRERQSGRAGDR